MAAWPRRSSRTARCHPAALDDLAATLAAVLQAAVRPTLPTGELTAGTAAAVVGALLPEGAIVVDEANASGLWLPGGTAGAPRHDWLTLTGGAIGQGLPLAAGAALACPDRPVLCPEADGSAMHTISALWTHAREELDITTVIFANGSYAILDMEESQRLATRANGPAEPSRGHISPKPSYRRCSEAARRRVYGLQGSRTRRPRRSSYLLSLPPVMSMRTARPASSRAAGIRNGEQET